MMEATMTAIETTGMVDEHHRLRVDEELPVSGPMRVRVIVLYPLSEGSEEDEWLRAAARNPAFEDLAAPEEDIYSLKDGEPSLIKHRVVLVPFLSTTFRAPKFAQRCA
jgi:hypothetical protein